MNRPIPVKLPEGYVEFYQDLESWQNEKQIFLKRACGSTKSDLLGLIVSQQKPLISLLDFELDRNAYQQLYLDLLVFLSKHRPDIRDTITALREQINKLDFESLPLKVLEDNQPYFKKVSEELNFPTQLFTFIADHALRPFLRVWAEPYQPDLIGDDLSWNLASQCPICGSTSHFSRLRREDGRRFMFCDRCFSEWETRYLYCVHCGNAEPETISFLALDNDPAYQLYTCEKCKGYLKTFDERQDAGSTDLFIANIETIYLDLLARQKGFISHDYE